MTDSRRCACTSYAAKASMPPLFSARDRLKGAARQYQGQESKGPLAKIFCADRSVGQAYPCPVRTPPPPRFNGKQWERIFSCSCAIVPKGRKFANFQTRTIGNDHAAKVVIAHNLEDCLSGFNSRRLHQYLQAFDADAPRTERAVANFANSSPSKKPVAKNWKYQA